MSAEQNGTNPDTLPEIQCTRTFQGVYLMTAEGDQIGIQGTCAERYF